MLTLNSRINNRHKIVQNLNGTIEGFGLYLKNRALFFYGDSNYSYYYINGYIAFINFNTGHWGLKINFDNSESWVKNAFDVISQLDLHNSKNYV